MKGWASTIRFIVFLILVLIAYRCIETKLTDKVIKQDIIEDSTTVENNIHYDNNTNSNKETLIKEEIIEEKEYKIIEDIEYKELLAYNYEITDEDNIKFIEQLKELDTIAYENNISLNQKLVMLRGNKYNSVYWGELMGYDDDNINSVIESSNPELFAKLRKEETIRINGTDFEIQTTHMYATMNCIKEGLGSLGGWKGDLCECIEQLDTKDYDASYTKAMESFTSDSLKFNKYDLYSDIAAVNISKKLSYSDGIGDVVEDYFRKAPNVNQYLLFIVNEFELQDINKSSLREAVRKSINEDLLVHYLMRTMKIDNKQIQIDAVCDAFADYLLLNISNEDLHKINVLYTDKEIAKIEKVEKELKDYRNKKYIELCKHYIENGGVEAIEQFLSTTKGYFSK